MVYSDKLKKNFHNPAIMRQHERDSAKTGMSGAVSAGKKPQMDAHEEHGGEAQHFEHHGPEHPENPSPGKHHTVATYEDGHEEHRDHADSQGAMEHHAEAMGGGEETCPECGGKMEGGSCPECGYGDGDGEEMGGGAEGDEY